MKKNNRIFRFGIKDRDGNLFKDIKAATLITQTITRGQILIEYKNEYFIISTDSKLDKLLKKQGYAKVIISLQKRTNENVAECRILETKESKTKENQNAQT
ncbi:MAG: hypothetical protein ACD_86C00003G0003 [uncultured bacterium]|nr:MAG: hypothetical protein ACD_86C00003G0003 [uncultured bacterium]